MTDDNTDEQSLHAEIVRLEKHLSALQSKVSSRAPLSLPASLANGLSSVDRLPSHALLILSDSALPLGSFAFSSGLESFLAHHSAIQNAKSDALPHFINLTLTSFVTTTLPYLIAAYQHPQQLLDLDDSFDACTLCPVAKRASIAQGKALMTLWDRALQGDCPVSEATKALAMLSKALKSSAPALDCIDDQLHPSGHFFIVWSAICCASSVALPATVYTFLLGHVKAVVSAAVRASLVGPYAAQRLLGSRWLKEKIEGLMDKEWGRRIEDAGQGVPLMDVWVGRHEKLYSRIFNS